MKKRTRVLGILMCMVLAFGCLTGCGGQKSDEELLMASVTGINNAKSFDLEAKMSGKMSMAFGEESQDMDMSMDMKATCFTDPYKIKLPLLRQRWGRVLRQSLICRRMGTTTMSM